MSQTTTLSTSTSGPQTPAARATQINMILAALFSGNSGASAPASTTAFMEWIDISADPAVWKIRNVGNTAWINIATLSSAGVFTPVIGAGGITETMLASSAVSSAKIADGAVIEAKLGTAAVTEAKLASAAVVEAKLGAGAVTEAKIGAGAVATDKLANNAVTTAKMSVTGVTAAAYTNANITVDGAGRVTAASSGSAGGLSYIGTLSTASGSTASLTGIASARSLMLVMRGAQAGSARHLRVALSSNNGSSYGTPRQISDAASSDPFYGDVLIAGANVAGNKGIAPRVAADGGTLWSTVVLEAAITGTINALQVSPSGGNFEAGAIDVYALT